MQQILLSEPTLQSLLLNVSQPQLWQQHISINIASQLKYDIATHIKMMLVHLHFYLMMPETVTNTGRVK